MPSAIKKKECNTRQLPIFVKLSYGFGSIADGGINIILGVYLLFYFTQVQGLSGTLAGTAILIALIIDGITDPIVGSISDNYHSRWGRRHPFMYASIAPLGVCFYLLFNSPAGLSQFQLFVWMLIFMVGARVCFTFYIIPSNALAAELTDDFDERTRVVSWRLLFAWIGGVALTQLALRYFFSPTPEYADGRFNAAAYGDLGLMSALSMMVAIFVCSVGTHGMIPGLKQPPMKTQLSIKRFLGELKGPLSNRSFVMMVFSSLFSAAAVGYVGALTFYVETYFWELSTYQLAQFVYPLGLATLTGFLITSPLVARFDKKRVAIINMAIYTLIAPIPLYLRLMGLMPENGDPLLLPLLMCAVYFSSVLVVSNGIITGSMFVDIIDENELNTGLRQEGVFNSAIAFVMKAVSGIGGFISGLVLDLISFPQGGAPGDVDPETLSKLALTIGIGATILLILSLLCLARYDITRKRYEEIVSALAERKLVAV